MKIEELSKELKNRTETMLTFEEGEASITKEFDDWFRSIAPTLDFEDGVVCNNYDYALMQVSNNVMQFCIFSLKNEIKRISNDNHVNIQDEYFKGAIRDYTVRATIGEEIQYTPKTWEEEYFLIREYYKTYGAISQEVAKPMNGYSTDICSIETGEDNDNGRLTVTIIDGTTNEVVYTFEDVLESPTILIARKKHKIKYTILIGIIGLLGLTGFILYMIYKLR